MPKLFLFESALWKFNISEQRSRKNSALNLVSWWKVPSPRSSPARFSRTVAYGFPKTHALPAPTLGCAWDGRIWSRALSYEFVEMNLVGLMSLTTKNPPASPNLNRRRALFVLTKIDEILAWEQGKETERDTKFVQLGRYLARLEQASTGDW